MKAKRAPISEPHCEQCGKPGNNLCINCAAKQSTNRAAEKAEIVGRGICPKCGEQLLPHLELAGYWTCGSTNNARPCDFEILLC